LVKTELLVISEPVPAVVGSAIQGTPALIMGDPSKKGRMLSPLPINPAITFPQSRTLPPPSETTISQLKSVASFNPLSTVSKEGSGSTWPNIENISPFRSRDWVIFSRAPVSLTDFRPTTMTILLPIFTKILPISFP